MTDLKPMTSMAEELRIDAARIEAREPESATRMRWAADDLERRALGTLAWDGRSTLARGDEIEADFYRLKAQEWAVSPEQARQKIVAALATDAQESERLREALRALLDDRGVTYAVRASRARAALHADTRNAGSE